MAEKKLPGEHSSAFSSFKEPDTSLMRWWKEKHPARATVSAEFRLEDGYYSNTCPVNKWLKSAG